MTLVRLQNCEEIADNEVTKDGNIVHFSLLEDIEPIKHNKSLKNEVNKATMIE